jgi:hypothetical protein
MWAGIWVFFMTERILKVITDYRQVSAFTLFNVIYFFCTVHSVWKMISIPFKKYIRNLFCLGMFKRQFSLTLNAENEFQIEFDLQKFVISSLVAFFLRSLPMFQRK